jgi:hypothetical protein
MAKRITKKVTKKVAKKKVAKKPIQKGGSKVVKLGLERGKAPRFKDPVSQYGYRQTFVPSEYNLSEISLIEDGESYVRQAFQKKTSLMFKEGEVYTGLNEESINYVKTRIRQIEYVTGIPWRTLLKQTGKELIAKSNFFWVKVRRAKHSGGSAGVQRAVPVAGYFPMGAENVFVKKDEYGRVLEYEQRLPGNKTRKFKPSDVIHFKVDVKPGFTFGTPRIIPVIPDIQALRRLEENVEILFYQTLFPIFQYKVGTEAKPASTVTLPDGEVVDEVDYVRSLIQQMPSEGGVVTPERHEIKYIGAAGQIPNFQNVLAYFKGRVLAGLGISAIDIGEGDSSNRATAESLSKAIIDSVKDYQADMEEIVNSQVIAELLLEADFGFDVLAEENFVKMKFKEIDIEEQMKKNVNAQLMFNSDIIDLNEAREATGRQPLEDRQEDLMFTKRETLAIAEYEHELSKETADIAHKRAVELQKVAAKVAPKATGTATKAAKSKAESAKKSGANSSSPTNQHGTKTGPQKSRLDSLIEMESKTLEYFKKKYGGNSDLFLMNREAAKQRIIKRIAIGDSAKEAKRSVNVINAYFDAI